MLMEKKKYTNAEQALLKRVGENVKRCRVLANIKQEELAYESKVDRAYTGRVERGEKNISILKLKRLADTLGVDISEFFRIKGKI